MDASPAASGEQAAAATPPDDAGHEADDEDASPHHQHQPRAPRRGASSHATARRLASRLYSRRVQQASAALGRLRNSCPWADIFCATRSLGGTIIAFRGASTAGRVGRCALTLDAGGAALLGEIGDQLTRVLVWGAEDAFSAEQRGDTAVGFVKRLRTFTSPGTQ